MLNGKFQIQKLYGNLQNIVYQIKILSDWHLKSIFVFIDGLIQSNSDRIICNATLSYIYDCPNSSGDLRFLHSTHLSINNNND